MSRKKNNETSATDDLKLAREISAAVHGLYDFTPPHRGARVLTDEEDERDDSPTAQVDTEGRVEFTLCGVRLGDLELRDVDC